MKFHTLQIENFLTVSSARLGLDDRGLHVIQGENKMDSSANSNGAGKSSVVDALSWVLYGITARGIKGDNVVNRGAKKNTKVSLTVSNGATIYEIVRYRKHKEFKNALHLMLVGATHGETAVLTKGTDSETQKEVEKILGCSQEVFLASVYAGQEAMPNLPAMTDRELKSLVEEAAGLQRIELAYQEARQRLSASSGLCQNLQFQFEETQRSVARIVGNIVHQVAQSENWESDRAAQIQHYEDQVTEARAAHVEAAGQSDKASLLRPQLLDAQAKLRAALDGHRTYTSAAAAAQQELAAAQVRVAMLRQSALSADNADKQAREYIKQIIDGHHDSKPCVTCGTEPDPAKATEHREHILKIANGRALTTHEALTKATIALKSAADELVPLQEKASRAAAAVPDVTELTTKLAKINDALNSITAKTNAAKGAENALRMAEGNYATYKAQGNPYDSVVRTLRDEEASTNERMGKFAAQHKEELERYKVLEAVVALYGPAGVRAHILDTVTPYLNERTADYLSALSDGAITATWSTLSRTAAGAVREKFTIEVNHAHGGDSFAAISGGEKRKVRLACALALQDLVASRATQPLDLFVGDEIDDALDPAGLERLMTILERKARERGTVLVISHRDLSDWCDNITVVSKTEEYTSTVSGSLCI